MRERRDALCPPVHPSESPPSKAIVRIDRLPSTLARSHFDHNLARVIARALEKHVDDRCGPRLFSARLSSSRICFFSASEAETQSRRACVRACVLLSLRARARARACLLALVPACVCARVRACVRERARACASVRERAFGCGVNFWTPESARVFLSLSL